jgi:hypothetical protein
MSDALMNVYRFADVSVHSIPKNASIPNEDAAVVTSTAIVVADGATAKHIEGESVAPISAGNVARIVAETASASSLNGAELVAHLNAVVAHFANKSFEGTGAAVYQSSSCTLACVRLCGDTLMITTVGDTSVRVNGPNGTTYCQRTAIDDLTTAARAHYVALTGDINGSRDFIMPLLRMQSAYKNNETHPLGYGVIDGTCTPDKFIRTVTSPLASVESVEVFTDGYAKLPDGLTVAHWERAFAEMIGEDPERCLTFPSTKSMDDRTVVTALIESIFLL